MVPAEIRRHRHVVSLFLFIFIYLLFVSIMCCVVYLFDCIYLVGLFNWLASFVCIEILFCLFSSAVPFHSYSLLRFFFSSSLSSFLILFIPSFVLSMAL